MAIKISKPIVAENKFLISYHEKNKIPYPNRQTTISFTLEGYRELANALRRTFIDEIDGIKCLELDKSTLQSTEETIIIEYLAQRIMQIPLNQSAPLGKEFTLESKVNATPRIIDLYTHDISGLDKYVNQMKIAFIRQGRSISFKVRVVSGRSRDNANFNLVNTVAFKSHLEGGKPETNCFVDEPVKYDFILRTNGTTGKEIINTAIKSLLDRIETVRNQIPELKFDKKTAIGKLKIEGETHTFINIFAKMGLKNNTNIGAEEVSSHSDSFVLIITQVSRESCISVLNKCLDSFRDDLKKIKL